MCKDKPMETEKEILYHIWSNQQMAWWKSGSNGYTTHLEKAGLYSFDDALGIVKDANRVMKEVPDEAMVPVEVCADCLGTGFVSVMERVYPEEGSPMADIGTRVCNCQRRRSNDDE